MPTSSNQLSRNQYEFIVANVVGMGGTDMSSISYFDQLHRWALCGGREAVEYVNHNVRYKLKCGQSGLARCLFDHSLKTGNLSYSFSTPIHSINHSAASCVTANCTDGRVFSARKLICTIPLMLLKDLVFVPQLPPLKAGGIAQGRQNIVRKVHIQAEGKKWRSWSANRVSWTDGKVSRDPSAFMALGELHSASGEDSNLVFFAAGNIDPVAQPAQQVAETENLHPDMKVKRMVAIDWEKDPYSKGGWACHSPGYLTKCLTALQAPVGNLKFASGDYPDGWRGYIDGAIESGMLAAKEVDDELRDGQTGLAKL
ncbi:hypothetical protein BHE90_004902 [Fusarium euwallaceae]|uniref:Amine oxidase n=1 Tax=Fusarium euwallaceae TaxID=1147111 RepID=A0A430LY29_9HYPO|nr:hypothetical protein BHE90_004902 [Fusarium euwallaceae]